MQRRGTGFPGSEIGGKGNGKFTLNDPRAWEGLMNQQQFPNMLKEFTHPGKDPKELLMRCIFKDERERNAAVLYFAKCIEFKLTEELQVLTNWLASTVSVHGTARRELLMGATNIIAPALYGLKDRKGRGKEKDGNNQEGQ